jgi:TonB-linked SusC/RagA family outer membrane protein
MFKSLLLKGRTMCVLILCTLSSLVVTAQTRITGKVIGSDDKQPVIGATVKIKGTNAGAVTDANGVFSLSATTNDVLVISFIGYQSKQVPVTGASLGTITLEATNSNLNEVVVTGYTSQRKKDIAGAVAVVDLSAAKKIPASSTDQLLQGQAAGVTVVTQGAPGAASSVFIRGISNFKNSQPLYVIDGVQANSMSDLNPNDIESIQVLKDAGAAAIYGVSGGNGVVVITTKRGKAGKSVFTYDAYYGTQVPKGGNVYNAANPQEMSQLTYLAGDLTVGKALYPGGAGTVPVYGYQGPGIAGTGDASFDLTKYHFDPSDPSVDFLIQKFNQTGTDWFHAIFKSAPIQYHTISGSGSSDKNNYYFSVGYLDQQGTEINTYQKRYEARVNTVFNLSDHIRFGENGYAFYKNLPTNGFSNQGEGDPISYAYRMDPQIPVYDIAGNYGGTYDGPGGEPLGNSSNPVAVLNQLTHQQYRDWNVQGNMFAEVDLFKHFTVKTQYGGDISNQYANGYTTNPYMDYEGHNNANSAYENAQYYFNYNWTNTIQYKQTIGKHNISVLAGYEQRESSGRNVNAGGTNLFSTNIDYADVSNVTKNLVVGGYPFQPTATLSLFARADYIYNDRYILGATFRRDGYSGFYAGRQYGNFPSVSLAWRISQEDFLKSVTWINDLKLRGSYGVAGNNGNSGGGANAYDAYGSTFGNGYYPIGGAGTESQGFVNLNLGNRKTSWETDKIANIGIDASLFNHLDLNIEFYKKTISGLLFTDQAAATVGSGQLPAVNIGDVQNKGIDLAATYHDAIGKDFRFSVGANITIYKNLITKIPGNYFDEVGTRVNDVVREEVGHPIGEFFGYKVIGFYNPSEFTADSKGNLTIPKPGVVAYAGAVPGSFRYADVNGDGVVNDSDRTFLGNPNPNFTYGVNLSASYQAFDFSMVLYGSQGNKDFHYTKYFTDFYGSFQGGKSKDALYKSYGAPGVTNPTVPIQSDLNSMGTTQISSYYVEGGSFLKCRVAQLGYSFAPALLKTVGVTKLHIYVQATNLFTITKYTGLDPELPPNTNAGGTNTTNAFGVDLGNYPNNQRQYIVGVNLSF